MNRKKCFPMVRLPPLGEETIPAPTCAGFGLLFPQTNEERDTASPSVSSINIGLQNFDASPNTSDSGLMGGARKRRGSRAESLTGRQMMKMKKAEHFKQLQDALPQMNWIQVRRNSYSYKHYLFYDLLQDGFHATHSEIFGLMKYQADQRLKTGDRSPDLEHEQDKMCTMARRLMQAESSLLLKDYPVAYDQYLALAQYFAETGSNDSWLSAHFFYTALSVAVEIGKSDGGRILAEASCNVGKVFQAQGRLLEAAEQFEHYYELTRSNETWTVSVSDPEASDFLMRSDACVLLARIYTLIGNQLAERDLDFEASVEYLLKAYNVGREGASRKMFSEIVRQLAVAYERSGDSVTALAHLKGLLDSYCFRGDKDGVMRTLDSMAQSYFSLNRFNESLACLNDLIAIAEELNDLAALKHALNSIGFLCCITVQHDAAVEYLQKAFAIHLQPTTCVEIKSAIKSRVLCGIANGHAILDEFCLHVSLANRAQFMQGRLLGWKDTKQKEFLVDYSDCDSDSVA